MGETATGCCDDAHTDVIRTLNDTINVPRHCGQFDPFLGDMCRFVRQADTVRLTSPRRRSQSPETGRPPITFPKPADRSTATEILARRGARRTVTEDRVRLEMDQTVDDVTLAIKAIGNYIEKFWVPFLKFSI